MNQSKLLEPINATVKLDSNSSLTNGVSEKTGAANMPCTDKEIATLKSSQIYATWIQRLDGKLMLRLLKV